MRDFEKGRISRSRCPTKPKNYIDDQSHLQFLIAIRLCLCDFIIIDYFLDDFICFFTRFSPFVMNYLLEEIFASLQPDPTQQQKSQTKSRDLIFKHINFVRKKEKSLHLMHKNLNLTGREPAKMIVTTAIL